MPAISQMTHVTDLNVYISSFLGPVDIISFLKSSRELRNDLHNIPFKSFVLSSTYGMNEIKAMMNHLDVIESIEITDCNFIDYILLPMKKLKHITLTRCDLSDKNNCGNLFKCIENKILCLKNCDNIYSLIKDYPSRNFVLSVGDRSDLN